MGSNTLLLISSPLEICTTRLNCIFIYPNYIDRPSAWVGSELAIQPDQWLYMLADEDVADLEQAASHYLDSGRDIGEITKSDFPLDHFGHHLVELREKLLQGIGA